MSLKILNTNKSNSYSSFSLYFSTLLPDWICVANLLLDTKFPARSRTWFVTISCISIFRLTSTFVILTRPTTRIWFVPIFGSSPTAKNFDHLLSCPGSGQDSMASSCCSVMRIFLNKTGHQNVKKKKKKKKKRGIDSFDSCSRSRSRAQLPVNFTFARSRSANSRDWPLGCRRAEEARVDNEVDPTQSLLSCRQISYRPA